MEIGIKMTREEIMTVLKEDVAQVTFTKSTVMYEL